MIWQIQVVSSKFGFVTSLQHEYTMPETAYGPNSTPRLLFDFHSKYGVINNEIMEIMALQRWAFENFVQLFSPQKRLFFIYLGL